MVVKGYTDREVRASFRGSHNYHGRLIQEALQSSISGVAGSKVLSG